MLPDAGQPAAVSYQPAWDTPVVKWQSHFSCFAVAVLTLPDSQAASLSEYLGSHFRTHAVISTGFSKGTVMVLRS